MSEAINYKIIFDHVNKHWLTVVCSIARPNSGGQKVALPAWVPGSYLIRDFAKHLVDIRATSNNKDVPMVKIDKNTWQCAPCKGALEIEYHYYCLDNAPRGAYVDDQRVFFDGSRIFLVIEGEEEQTRSVEIVRPSFAKSKQWRCATSMDAVKVAADGFGTYTAANHLELIDHPFVISNFLELEFMVDSTPHQMVITGADAVDLTRLSTDLAKVCAGHVNYFGELPPMRKYLFIVQAHAAAYGGIEHRASASLVCARSDLPISGDATLSEGYKAFLGLVSHEYCHLWQVKRIKPEVFLNPDLYREVYTRQLWLFEGVVSYLDNLILVRQGLINLPDYLQMLQRDITKLQQTPGAYVQTLEDSSFDAWIKFYQPDENSINSAVSYYLKGSLAALALDLQIIVNSRCQQSLADMMQVLWQQYGKTGLGLPEGYFERIVFEVTGEDYNEFFNRILRTTDPLPLPELLLQVGVVFKNTETSLLDSFGWMLANEQDKLMVRSVLNGSVAEQAGITPNDQIVAVNNNAVNLSNIETTLKRYAPLDQQVILHVFRDQYLQQIAVSIPSLLQTNCQLELVAETNAQQELQRNKWLN